MNNELTIKFGGSGHIKVDTLTEYLIHYQNLIYAINQNFGYTNEELIIEVYPPENGSFKIKINPKYKEEILKRLDLILLGTFSGLMVVWLSPKQDNLTKDDIIHIIQAANIPNENEIGHEVYNLYQDVEIKQTINNTYKIISNDANVESLEILNNENQILNIPKSSFQNYIRQNDEEIVEIEKNEQEVIEEATIIIKTIHFEGIAKWGFIWNGYSIKASIKDETFLRNLKTEAFTKGDILKVILKKKIVFNDEFNTFIVDEKSYEVIEVTNHISREKNNNSDYKLSFND